MKFAIRALRERALLSSVVLAVPLSAQLQPGGQPIQSPHTGRWYTLSPQPVTIHDARDIARRTGYLELAVIRSEAEQAFIRLVLTGSSATTVWIGLTDEGSEGQFVWLDGEPVSYQNWRPGEPNNCCAGEDYTELVMPTAQWNDIGDTAVHHALFEFDGELGAGFTRTADRWFWCPVNAHYFALTPPGSWEAAERYAQRLGGHLATIDSAGEQAWIEATLLEPSAHPLWIGLRRDGVGQPWRWASGVPLGAYTNFAAGQQGGSGLYGMLGDCDSEPRKWFGSDGHLRPAGCMPANRAPPPLGVPDRIPGLVEVDDPCVAATRMRAPFAGMPLIYSLDDDTALGTRNAILLRCGGFETTPARAAPDGPADPTANYNPSLGSLRRFLDGIPVEIDAFSLGFDDILVEPDGHVSELAGANWFGLIFSLREPSTRPLNALSCGGQLGDTNVRGDVYGFLFESCELPFDMKGQPFLVYDDDLVSTMTAGTSGVGVDALDAHGATLYSALRRLDRYPTGDPATTWAYFSVTSTTAANIPSTWFVGGVSPAVYRSGATIWRIAYERGTNGQAGSWDKVLPFISPADLLTNVLPPGSYPELAEVDALSVDAGRQRIVFSTDEPDLPELLVTQFGVDGVLPTTELRTELSSGGQSAGTVVGARGGRRIDAVCAIDPRFIEAQRGSGAASWRSHIVGPPCADPPEMFPTINALPRTVEISAFFSPIGGGCPANCPPGGAEDACLDLYGFGMSEFGLALLSVGFPAYGATDCRAVYAFDDFRIVGRAASNGTLHVVLTVPEIPGLFDSGQPVDLTWFYLPSSGGGFERSHRVRVWF
ncbi:MAG: hypothetical protein IPM29_11875 [Planctomycetes bacterium]|nr:hypothetical protein [Planctomycetota bacterium]